MSLNIFPVDVLKEILCGLNGENIMHLWLAGDSHLNYFLASGAVSHFCADTLAGAKRLCLTQFRALCSVSLKQDATTFGSSSVLRISTRVYGHLDPEFELVIAPEVKLRRLVLEFDNSLKHPLLTASNLDISHLELLACASWRDLAFESLPMVENLANLVELVVPSALLSLKDFQLPHSLRTLLAGLIAWDNAKEFAGLPSKLESLQIVESCPSYFSVPLPPSLTSYSEEAEANSSYHSTWITATEVSLLPRTLTKFIAPCADLNDPSQTSLLANLPPSLVYLHLVFAPRMTTSQLLELPRGLKVLKNDIDLALDPIAAFRALPPNLTVIGLTTYLPAEVADALPRSLEVASLEKLLPSAVLPPSLTQLALRYCDASIVAVPEHITTLKLQSISSEAPLLRHLPSNLKSLTVYFERPSNYDFLSHLPRGLSSLYIFELPLLGSNGLQSTVSKEDISSLPPKLKHLFLQASVPNWTLFGAMPLSVEELTCLLSTTIAGGDASETFLAHRQLTTLFVYLPPNLGVEIYRNGVNYFMNHLPPNIEKLTLGVSSVGRGAKLGLTPATFMHLPKSLNFLSLLDGKFETEDLLRWDHVPWKFLVSGRDLGPLW